MFLVSLLTSVSAICLLIISNSRYDIVELRTQWSEAKVNVSRSGTVRNDFFLAYMYNLD